MSWGGRSYFVVSRFVFVVSGFGFVVSAFGSVVSRFGFVVSRFVFVVKLFCFVVSGLFEGLEGGGGRRTEKRRREAGTLLPQRVPVRPHNHRRLSACCGLRRNSRCSPVLLARQCAEFCANYALC